MRQFLLSGSVLSAVASGIALVRQSFRGPLTWQIALLWASWIISLVLAIATVRERSQK